MLPITPPTVFYLVLIGVALFSALAVAPQLRSQWRISWSLLATSLPAGLLLFDPPTGQYAGLGYLFVIVPSLVAALIGAICGGIMRFVTSEPSRSAAVLGISASVLAGAVLWGQYVPSSCQERGLEVRIAGTTLRVPPEMQPRVENGDKISFFGWIDRKYSYARLCRMSQNGTRALDMDTVWITPATSHDEMTAACERDEPPAWCNGYLSEPYRRMVKVIIEPFSTPIEPTPYWPDGGSLKTDRQGDLTQGSICLLPNDDIVTQCWTWAPFGDGSRLTVSTNNGDKIFAGMPVEQAREMVTKARDITLAIIGP